MPKKIRELMRDLEKAGFVNRGGKGSHRNYKHPEFPAIKPITLSGKSGSDALTYQERDVLRVIKEVSDDK